MSAHVWTARYTTSRKKIELEKNKKHNIEIIVDRLVIKPDITRRLTDSAETALSLAGGLMYVDLPGGGEQLTFSQNYACDDCGISIEELTPRLFSFNSPHGACPKCTGLGVQMLIDPELIMPNPNLSIMDGGLTASGWNNVRGDSISRMYFDALAKRCRLQAHRPDKGAAEGGDRRDPLRHKGRGAPAEIRKE